MLQRKNNLTTKRWSEWRLQRYLFQFWPTYIIAIIFTSIGDTIADSDLSTNLTETSITTGKSSFTVYRLNPETKGQTEYLLDLLVNSTKIDFWKAPRVAGGQVHVMIREEMKDGFLKSMKTHNISYSVMIDDVEKKIRKLREKANRSRHYNWLRDDPSSSRRVHFNLAQYHSYNEILNYLDQLSAAYPDRTQVRSIGVTHEGRQLKLIKIGKPRHFQKAGIWIDGGIHAREWVSPSTVLYMIDQLVTKYDVDPQIQRLVDELDWFIVPLLNPDGYEYTRSSTNPEVRLWRKNRSPLTCRISHNGIFSHPQQKCCQGVDLNRNYDWQYGMEGSSNDPCSEIYQGPSAFSEPETRAVYRFIAERRHIIKTFLTFHSYSQILMYPFGHRERTYTSDVDDLRSTALQAANALRAAYGTQYTVGTGADTLYPASGGAEDWAKGRMGIKYSYLFELRPDGEVWDGFLLDESQIIPTARESFEAVKVIANRTSAMFTPKNITPIEMNNSKRTTCVDNEQFLHFFGLDMVIAVVGKLCEKICARSCGFL
ncbi:carboxypeptidase A1 [Loa loa]|uniref:Zinc carboxypeptidase A 1 n=1 Tax=Loa loa TaxID=7209 RepID=A0A1S0UGQ2_LOALO|nr:carboxypeptidase A1 [Loa loa]EJD74733.1 carboxypeptidase A1 [Loa loa]